MDGGVFEFLAQKMRVESIFLLEDIREILDPVPPLEQPPTIEASLTDTRIPEGVEMGKEAQPPLKAKLSEDALTIRDVVSQAKDVEAKSKADDVPPKTADPKKDPPQDKA
ncbi:hypothetical protein SO802_004434 [Lithocarpus litseifolius]|uniref:Uncharacterized protein n=1 Tax=Lithocarpus litseifolius TaxID=425828 RepID=A0AAW2E6V8_9ROSI